MNGLWAAPILILLAGIILYVNLGVSSLAGMSLIVLFLPVQYFLSKYLSSFRISANKHADSRMKMIQESLAGIRVIKIYAWESSFLKIISKIRKMEIKYVRLFLGARAFTSSFTQSVPVFSMILTFVVYSLMGNALSATIILPALSMFYVLRLPMILIPTSLAMVCLCLLIQGY